MLKRIAPVIRKEFRQIARDRRSLGLLLGFPAFLIVVIGYAVNFDVKHISLAVLDQEKSSMSRAFVQTFVNNEYFDYTHSLADETEIDQLLNRGNALIALVIPRDFSKDLLAGRDASVQIIIDGSNANSASIALGYTNAAVQSYSTKLTTTVLQRWGRAVSMPLDFRPKVWYNPELSTAKFLLPGLIGFILMITGVLSTSMSVVREKERGTMEQIVVSPLKTYELILGKTIPYLLIALASSMIILLIGNLLFGVSVRGSILWLYVGIVLFLLGALGQGLLISTIAHTQQVAFMISVLSSLLPTFLLSGFVFPIRSMPVLLQILCNLTPAKFFLVVVRSNALKGAGPDAFWDQLIFLTVFAAVTLGLSSLRLRKRIHE